MCVCVCVETERTGRRILSCPRNTLQPPGFSKILFSEYQEENNLSCWLDLIIDDAVLRFHAADPNIEVGIVGVEEGDYTYRKRKNLFETNN